MTIDNQYWAMSSHPNKENFELVSEKLHEPQFGQV